MVARWLPGVGGTAASCALTARLLSRPRLLSCHGHHPLPRRAGERRSGYSGLLSIDSWSGDQRLGRLHSAHLGCLSVHSKPPVHSAMHFTPAFLAMM